MTLMKLPERFWSKVDMGGPDECWLWTAATVRGYGSFWWNGTQRGVHRLVYAEVHDLDYLPSLSIDHTCHNADPECIGGQTCVHRRCVNPAHLEQVTSGVNLLRSTLTLASKEAQTTHCPAGHEYTDENTYVWRKMRHCRECARVRSREYQRRKHGFKPRV